MLAPAITRQGRQGWNILAALEDVLRRAQAAGDEHSAAAVAAVDKRARKVCTREAASLLGVPDCLALLMRGCCIGVPCC